MKLLAVESSCDDTAAAVLVDGEVRASVVAAQDAVHNPYGGVVPELASRSHMRAITPTIERALREAAVRLEDLDAVAATYGPGLVGSLLVGLCAAKAIAFARGLPFLGVNHLEGHLLSVQLDRPVAFPYVALLVSGGHTSLYLARALGDYALLGATRDDAAGEAFDKVAKLLGLSYPGGRVIDAVARDGNPRAIRFPRARLKPAGDGERFDFSFSGIKTAVALHVREHLGGVEAGTPPGRSFETGVSTAFDPSHVADIAASFQEAVVDMLLDTACAAVSRVGAQRLVIAGGVSANSRLRARAEAAAAELGIEVTIPSLRYCTDNAAMIGWAAAQRLARGERDPLTLNACAVADLTAPRGADG